MSTTIPNPGSDEAVEQSCICPVLDNNHGQGVDGGYWWITRDCPLHGAKERKMTDKYQLGLAEAQLLGYCHCRDGYNLATLVAAMGLTLTEWKELQANYTLHYLDDDEREAITKQLTGDN